MVAGAVLITILMISNVTGLKITNNTSNKTINLQEENENLKYFTEEQLNGFYTKIGEEIEKITKNENIKSNTIYGLIKEAIESSISKCDVEGYDFVLDLETLHLKTEQTKTLINNHYIDSKQKDENNDQIQPLVKTLKITTKKSLGGIVAGAKVELWRVFPLGPAFPGLDGFYLPLWKIATGRTNFLGYCELNVRNHIFFRIHAEKGKLKGDYPEYILSGTIISIWDGDSKDITVTMKSIFDTTKSKKDITLPIYRFQFLEKLLKKFNIF